jgi:hypothetical protein
MNDAFGLTRIESYFVDDCCESPHPRNPVGTSIRTVVTCEYGKLQYDYVGCSDTLDEDSGDEWLVCFSVAEAVLCIQHAVPTGIRGFRSDSWRHVVNAILDSFSKSLYLLQPRFRNL